MLWYKAWLETRVRFLMCLVAITTLCAANVSRMEVNREHYDAVLRTTGAQLVLWWLLGVNLLVMGGLLREKAVGAAQFTLALPVSRMRLTVVRMVVSLAQAMTLILIPSSAAIAMGVLVGKTLSISEALFHLALLAGGGVLLFAIVFLVSSVVEGEYTAPMVSCGVLVIIALQLGEDASLRAYNPVAFMLGSRIDDVHTGMLLGSVPWMRIAAYVLLAACLIAASVKAIQVREF
jgi:ABC-2 type transport system permease protein